MVMDGITVLEELVKCIKQLQEKVKTLEEQMNSDSGSCSRDENFSTDPQEFPQIEARVSGRNVRIRILCVKCKGIQVKALTEIEKLNLRVVNSSAIPFGNSLLDISLVAQMDGEFTMTMNDLVECMRSSLIQFMGDNLC